MEKTKEEEEEEKRGEIIDKNVYFQNKVITAYLVDKYGSNVELDLRSIAACENERGIKPKYDPKKFNPIIFKYKEPSGPVLLFRNGSILCAGTRSFVEAKYLIYKTIQNIKKNYLKPLDIFVKPDSFKEENLVGNVQLPYKIHADYTGKKRKTNRFTGITQRLPDFPGISILTFESGKVVATGAKSEKDVITAIHTVEPSLYKRRKTHWNL